MSPYACVVHTTYPLNCANPLVFRGYPISSDLMCYTGVNLASTEILTNDSITLAIQKIDTKLNTYTLVSTILAEIQSNPELKILFCNIVSGC